MTACIQACVRMLALAGLMSLAAAPFAAPAVVPDEEHAEAAYEEFRRLFASGQFAEALPRAEQYVRATESLASGHDRLPAAYNSLGTVQLRLGDLDGAEASFRRALELLEARVGIASRRLIAPLAGLGAVHAARGHHALAADTRQHALAISRRADGLFNIGQLDLLESLIESYELLGNDPAAVQERRYAVQVVQQEFGQGDPRTIPTLIRLAEFYEQEERFDLARIEWQNVRDAASTELGGYDPALIRGLLGIARNHRLQFVHDPQSLLEEPIQLEPWTDRPGRAVNADTPLAERLPCLGCIPRRVPIRLDRDGEAAALRALELLEQAPDPPRESLAGVLLELGDWHMTAGSAGAALPYYRRAWTYFESVAGPELPNPLAVPRPLVYRPPDEAIRNRDRTDVGVEARSVQLVLNVTATGETEKIVAASADGADHRAAQVRRALVQARFSPRFDGGEPVATDGFRFTETWYEVAAEPAPEPASSLAPSSP